MEMSELTEEQQAAAVATLKVWLLQQPHHCAPTFLDANTTTDLLDTLCPRWLANGPERATRLRDVVSSQQRAGDTARNLHL